MAKGHPYAFNMGHGKIIPFSDYKEAAEALMERNMPEVLHNKQTKAIFLPETHLPKIPRAVDLEEYEEKKKSLTEKALEFLGIKKGREDVVNAAGDIIENELSEALKEFYKKRPDSKVVVLQGCVLRALKNNKWGNQENDFIIVDFKRKAIFCIESKATLTGSTGYDAAQQTLKLKSLLEEYFATELSSGELR